MRRLTTMILAAALLAPASGLAMQKMRTTNTKRVVKKTEQKMTPMVTMVHVKVVPLSAVLTGSKLPVKPGALSSVAAGLEKSAAGADVVGNAPTRVQSTSLAKRSNKQVEAAKKAEEAARVAAQQRVWAD